MTRSVARVVRSSAVSIVNEASLGKTGERSPGAEGFADDLLERVTSASLRAARGRAQASINTSRGPWAC